MQEIKQAGNGGREERARKNRFLCYILKWGIFLLPHCINPRLRNPQPSSLATLEQAMKMSRLKWIVEDRDVRSLQVRMMMTPR